MYTVYSSSPFPDILTVNRKQNANYKTRDKMVPIIVPLSVIREANARFSDVSMVL